MAVGFDALGEHATDKDFEEFYELFSRIEPTAEQMRLTQTGVPPPPSDSEKPLILGLKNVLEFQIDRMLNAFNLYNGFTAEERNLILAYYPSALRVALLLTRPDIVSALRQLRRSDVYPDLWHLVLIENFKFMLLPISNMMVRVLQSYAELESLNDEEFKQRYEREWLTLQPFRDAYSGYWVHPRIGVAHMVRYLGIKKGSRDIRCQTSDYLVHLCQERVFVLEVVAPLFKDKAFRKRVRAAYRPLIANKVKAIVRRSEANRQEASGEYGRHIRKSVEEAFDVFLRDFDYYFKNRPEGLGIPRWGGSLGGLTQEDRSGIAERAGLVEILPPDWDREIAFTHYIEQKLGSLACTLAGTTQRPGEHARSDRTEDMPPDDELVTADPDGNDDSIHISDQSYLADTEKEQIRVRKSRERRNKTDSPEGVVIGPDGKTYLMVDQMATKASDTAGLLITPYQLRQWAKSGLVSATKRSAVFNTSFTVRRDYWLFEPTEHILNQIVRTAEAMSGTPTGMITRSRLSEILKSQGRPGSPKTLYRYEQKGLLTPVRVGGNICYSAEEAARLAKQPPVKPGRPQRDQHRSSH